LGLLEKVFLEILLLHSEVVEVVVLVVLVVEVVEFLQCVLD
jgi:hypothetical protein